ncbi:MAG TPA: hypothetical protein VGG06_26595 [Thermoanaerobaculia bacterium]
MTAVHSGSGRYDPRIVREARPERERDGWRKTTTAILSLRALRESPVAEQIELDPEEAERQKQRRLLHLNTVRIPVLRVVGWVELAASA